jgi:peptidoglycan/xylan/chitin deacetylase (PgdA/CDA1 family)
LPHWRRLGDGRQAIKAAVWLGLFHSGLYGLIRRLRKGTSRGAILLYHRVNDASADVLTASTRRFAEHLVVLRHYYRSIATDDLLERVASHKPIEPTSVAIHFDDCYRDVRTFAAPLLAAAGVPAVAFISSGFVDSDRVFLHDEDKYPQRFANLRSEDLKQLPALGVAIAAHTVNHADLGTVSLEQAGVEVIESRRQLEEVMGRPVLLFSFPFGKISNIREEVRQMVAGAGYRALFSAGGGFVDQNTALLDVPRFGVSSDHSPLALMMELEGISLEHFRYWLRGRFRRQGSRPAP